MNDDAILVRGEKRVGPRSANTRMDDNVLTNGSILCVADGQCVLVVKQGKLIDVCREPGEHIFEDPEQGGLKGFFREVGRRVAFGGGDIQPVVYRVYYLNVKEITGVPFRLRTSLPYRVRDQRTGLDLDSGLRLGGCFSYRVEDPEKLYKTVIGNVSGRFSRRELEDHLRAELTACFQPALAEQAAKGQRPWELPGQVPALCEALEERLKTGWWGEHGLALVSVAFDAPDVGDAALLQSTQHAAMLQDPALAGAALTQAAAEALPAAARSAGSRAIPVSAAGLQGDPRTPWTCVCGQENDSPFCRGCGRRRPEDL
jgi:membrane protease subunit (stomatin/prohibitin family)